jgi:hypothetical protein
LVDNRAGGFNVVNPEWGRREVRLADVAVSLMSRGGQFVVVTRPDDHNRAFLNRLRDTAAGAATEHLLTVIERESLHTKGILTKRGVMLGSMNLTYNGVELNDELVEYDTDPAGIASARLAFQGYREGTP